MLSFLQSGRGIAALMVVLYHLGTTIFGSPKYWPQELWSGFHAGHAGVYFFFVLSGFIIAWAHAKDVDNPDALPQYGFRRFVRVYPVYWIVLLSIVPLYFIFPGMGAGYETQWWQIASSALLWPTENMPVLAVAWTLRHEMLFYMVFSLLLLSRKAGIAVLGLWFAGCLAVLLTGVTDFPISFVFSPINLLFPMGMAAAVVIRTAKVSAPRVILIAGLVGFIFVGWIDVSGGSAPLWLAVGYGLASALIILSGVELERSGQLRNMRPLTILGDASYSIYLVHYPALSAIAKTYFAFGLNSIMPAWVGFIALFVGAVVAGLLFRLIIEKPVINLLRRFEPAAGSFSRKQRLERESG